MRKTVREVDEPDRLGLFSLSDLSAKSYYYIKANGFGAYLKKVLLSTVELFVKHQKVVLFENDLLKVSGFVYPKLEVEIRMGTHNDIAKLRRLLPQWSERVFRHRVWWGDIFFIAETNNRIIHQVWFSFKDKYAPLLNRKIILKREEAYGYHVYTDPKFRCKNIAAATRSKALRHLKTQGFRRCFFLVDLNTDQLARGAVKIFGTNRGTIISYWRILGFRNYRYQPYRGVK